MAERGRTWTDAETAKLLEIWSEDRIQAQLRGAVCNEVPFRKIVDELEKAGYQHSCSGGKKIKSLKKYDNSSPSSQYSLPSFSVVPQLPLSYAIQH